MYIQPVSRLFNMSSSASFADNRRKNQANVLGTTPTDIAPYLETRSPESTSTNTDSAFERQLHKTLLDIENSYHIAEKNQQNHNYYARQQALISTYALATDSGSSKEHLDSEIVQRLHQMHQELHEIHHDIKRTFKKVSSLFDDNNMVNTTDKLTISTRPLKLYQSVMTPTISSHVTLSV